MSTINDPGVTSSPALCSYKKGVCNLHGRGAKLGWKKITKNVVGPDGRTTTRDTRKYFYTCGAEIGPRKKKIVQQTLPLSFTRDAKAFSVIKGDNDAKQEGVLGMVQIATEGQANDGCMAGIKREDSEC